MASSRAVPASALTALRIKLTLWYLAILCVILVLLGGGLFVTIRRQLGNQLRASLRAATAQLEVAARTREQESGAQGRVVDAVEELQIADRVLYLLDTIGTPVTPRSAPEWIRRDAVRAARLGTVDDARDAPGDRVLQLHAERFALADHRPLIAVAVADEVELEDRYAALIAAFTAAAGIALVMVAAGSWVLVRKSTEPIERNMLRMRQFMADAAHELRTPISVIRSQAEVALQRDRPAGEYAQALRGVETEGRRLGAIVDDLLTLARADSGERPVALERVFLDDIVAGAVAAAGSLAVARGVTLSIGGFEEAAVQGDHELLHQLVMILLDNAIKFTPPGGAVAVTVGTIDDGVRMFEVTDSGPGIPVAERAQVFGRFYRGDPARGRNDQGGRAASGAGLGLAIARWIADAHHARIEIVGAPMPGTRVVVRFPAAA